MLSLSPREQTSSGWPVTAGWRKRTARRLRREGCEILTAGREKVDLRRQQAVEDIFLSAAKVGGILAIDTKPAHRSKRFAVLGCCLAQASSDLALSGGCAMNSVANGKVRRETAFRRVYVQAAAGDAGGAIGAAFAEATDPSRWITPIGDRISMRRKSYSCCGKSALI